MTQAERDELLDAVETVERELDEVEDGVSIRDVTLALANLVARCARVWLVTARVTEQRR